MIKKECLIKYMLVIFAIVASFPMFAHDIEVKNADGVTIYYGWRNDSELYVTYRGDNWSDGRHCYSGIVVIPEFVIYGGNTYSVTCIGSGAFFGDGLTSVTIPNSVTTIWSSAFMDCMGLRSLTIPNSVMHIEDGAFMGCFNLTSIVSEIKNPFKIGGAFGSSSATLIVPAGTKSLYQSTAGWNEFQNIVEASEGGGIGEVFESGGINYRIGENNTVSVTEGNTIYSGALVIPNQVTYLGTTYSVTSIEYEAFMDCSGLTSITIPNSVTSIEGQAFWGCSSLTSITIGNSVTFIGDWAFNGCSGLTSVHITDLEAWCKILFGDFGEHESNPLDYAHHLYMNGSEITNLVIPNSVTSIGDRAFVGCSGLTSIKIPNSVTSIGSSAFYGCKGLTTIVSEIETPFVIESENYNSVFSDDTYIVAELIVPYGTKAAYQATEGWNKFTMITEAADKDGTLFTIDRITYEGSKSERTVIVKSVDKALTSLKIPASIGYDGTDYQVIGLGNDAFKGCSMGALIWDIDATLPNNAFSNASIGSNFLLYVKSANYAPSTVKNVVVDGTAQTIVLSDNGGQFYCPQTFIARNISYTHNYTMETGGNGKGWEALALPFFVQKITHSTRGEIVPFALYSSSSSQKPFWLAKYSGSEFKRTSVIEANEPYIIAMPNNSKYRNEYNLAGEVTFSAENAAVPKTPSFSGKFLPAFAPVAKSDAIMALNNSNYSSGYEPGSHFVKDLRDVHPFEAYIIGNSSSRGVIEINLEDGTTDIDDILLSADDTQEITIHSLSGQQVARTIQRNFDQIWNGLPKGVYIVNGKKYIK